MRKPTYEELEAEVTRLRALSFGDDTEFTEALSSAMPRSEAFINYTSCGRIMARPKEIWDVVFPGSTGVTTNDLAILGRSLQALGWQRSAHRGNVVFKISVEEHDKCRGE